MRSHKIRNSDQPRGLTCSRTFPLLWAMAWLSVANATPPDYRSFDRDQDTAPADLADESEFLEVWAIYIGQGDAFLIRLPESMNYDRDGNEERIDILVDGGPGLKLRQFLNNLYPDGAVIEHVVLTHHDSDHVKGLTKLLADENIGIGDIYHNGLASWARGVMEIPDEDEQPRTGLVFQAERGLGLVDEADNETLLTEYFIDDIAELVSAQDQEQFQGVYAAFAEAIDSKDEPGTVEFFGRALRGEDFIGERDDRIGDDIIFEVLWPAVPQRRYRGWGETINGNSVTFRLEYADFSMMFSGDHNEYSEAHWLEMLDGQEDELRSDVLKIPHHGSQHNAEEFFDAVAPVLGIASMGGQGFRPKWKHPSEEVVQWIGGSHRIYSTYIHERRFKYENLTTELARNAFVESKHVLVQTDGNWFLIVEVEDPTEPIPSVTDTKRGDGTRWVSARE